MSLTLIITIRFLNLEVFALAPKTAKPKSTAFGRYMWRHDDDVVNDDVNDDVAVTSWYKLVIARFQASS